MVNAQEWLDKNYPKEKRSEVEEIYLNEPSLEGELDLGDFTHEWGVEIYISLQVDETKLIFKNKPVKAFIILQERDAQTNLDYNYPTKKQREQITKLDISSDVLGNKDLTGELDLSDFVNLKELNCWYNNLTSLNISNCSQLEKIECRNNLLTTITFPTNPTNLEWLSLYNNNLPEQEKIDQYGYCLKCLQINTSRNWCQTCAEKEWKEDIKNLTGQELVEKFIQQQQAREEDEFRQLKWIPYEEFADIEYLAEGGFSKIYKAKWESRYIDKDVVIKSLNNSQNITLDFLQEVANTKLASINNNIGVIKFHGISQDPQTKNYVMVMDYMKDGNLREYLKNKYSELSLERKLKKLWVIAVGLRTIHYQNLVHQDFHSGNVLNYWDKIDKVERNYITDFGLSCYTDYQRGEGEIFGVLPYVAPEVLRGEKYTQASDIYSFGIVVYELLANSYPYYEHVEDKLLSLRIIQDGLRPNIDKLPIPQLLKDLIKKCWDADPKKRPSAEELAEIVRVVEINEEIEKEYNTFSQNTPYQIHPTATTTSKMIDTKTIARQLSQIKSLGLDIANTLDLNLDELNIQEDPQEQSSLQSQIQQPPK